MSRTTLAIDDDVLAIARQRAEQRSISIGSALSELARKGAHHQAVGVRIEYGHPVADIPSGTRPIRSEDVYKALEELD